MKKFPRIDKATKSQRTVPVLENQIHLAIAKYLDMVIKRPSRWHTVEVSNQAKGRAAMFRQVALKARGVRTGWPDIEIIFINDIKIADNAAFKHVFMLFLEVKIPGGKLTEKQEALHLELKEDGHNVYVVNSVDDVKVILTNLGVI